MNWVDLKYARLLGARLPQFKAKGTNLFNFRCPLCGDSKKNKHKKRGFLYPSKGRIRYKCHNCAVNLPLGEFINMVAPELAKEYRLEQFRERRQLQWHTTNFPAPAPAAPAPPADSTLLFHSDLGELLPSISNLAKTNPLHPCVEYVRKRLIPEETWLDLYFAENFSVLEKLNLQSYFKRLPHDSRLVIPFRDQTGHLVGATGRMLEQQDGSQVPRYLTVRCNDAPLIYGLEKFNACQPAFVVEGPLDSLFLPNALAAGSSDLPKVFSIINREQTTFIFDNQPRNEHVVGIMERLIQAGNVRVCIWAPTFRWKDINEAIMAGLTTPVLTELISACTYSGLALKTKFSLWRRCNYSPGFYSTEHEIKVPTTYRYLNRTP